MFGADFGVPHAQPGANRSYPLRVERLPTWRNCLGALALGLATTDIVSM